MPTLDPHAKCAQTPEQKLFTFRRMFDGIEEVDQYVQDAEDQCGPDWIEEFRCGTEIAEDFVVYVEHMPN